MKPTYLQLVQIIAELLKPFLKGYETGGQFGSRSASCLHHLLLVEKGFETQLELHQNELASCTDTPRGLPQLLSEDRTRSRAQALVPDRMMSMVSLVILVDDRHRKPY